MSQPDPTQPQTCEQANKNMRLFALGELTRSNTRAMRAHLAECEACTEQYRNTVQTAAALGRMGQGKREQRAIERQKHNLHVKHFGPREPAKTSGRQYRLRLLLMPAVVIALLTQVARLGEPPVRVELVGTTGVVKVDEVQRTNLEQPYLILPGRWIVTQQFSQAELDGSGCDLVLGSETSCLLESARPVRLRLERGRLDVDGDLLVITVLGLLQVAQGQGRVVLDERGLHIEAQSGTWTWMDKSGERILPVGQQVTIPSPVGVVSSSPP